MKRILKILMVFILIIVSFIILLSVLGIILEDKLTSFAVSQLNKHINAKIDVRSADVSFIKGFPFAAITLDDVSINEGSLETPLEFEPGLIKVKELTLKLNLIGIINNKYEIDELILNDGWINLYFNNEGRGNFEIFNQTGSPSGNWLLDLKSLRLKGISINYFDLRTGWIMKGVVNSGNIRGVFTSGRQSIKINTSTRIGLIKQGSFQFFNNQDVDISTSLKINENEVIIEKSNAFIDRNKLKISGSLGRSVGSPIYLSVMGQNIDAEFLLSFLSQYNYSLGSNLRTRGKIAFTFSIDGYNKIEKPYVFKLNFSSDRFSLLKTGMPSLIINKLSGSFTNGPKGIPETSEISVSFERIIFSDSKVGGSLKIKNIFSPLYHLKANVDLSLKDLGLFAKDLPANSGYVQGEFEALGRLGDINIIGFNDFENSKIFANMKFRELSLIYGNYIIQNASGSLNMSNSALSILNASGFLNDSPFGANINIENPPALVFGKGKSNINVSISLDQFNTKWLFDDSDSLSVNKSNDPMNNVNMIEGNVKIGRLVHDNLELNENSFDLSYFDDNLLINNYSGNSCGGAFNGKLYLTLGETMGYKMVSDINIQKVNITNLFQSFNNFDQSIIQSENISGSLSGSVSSRGIFRNGTFFNNDLTASASLRLENGRLVNVEQLKSLSRFISLDELNDIRFETLENSFRIENQLFIIPKMEVRSTALNLSVTGQHSFDNKYLYSVQLLLSEVLFRKASERNPQNKEFGDVVEDKSGRVNLYLKIEGDSVDYSVSYDRLSARKAIIENLKEESQTLREILREEFGLLKKRSTDGKAIPDSFGTHPKDTLKTKDIKKEKDKETKKFTIEWDE